MFSFFFRSVKFFFVFLLSSAVWASGKPFVLSDHLTPRAIHALREAEASSGYKVRLLVRGEENRTQIVALVGEIHVKNQSDSELGKNLLKEFKMRAVETLNVKKSGAPIHLLNKFVGCLYRSMRACSRENKYQSTIKDAGVESYPWSTQGLKDFIELSKRQMVEFTQKYSIDQMSVEQRTQSFLKVKVPDSKKGLVEKIVTFEEFYQIRGNLDPLFYWDTTKPTSFWLEENHVGTLAESIGASHLMLGMSVCIAAGCSFIPYANLIFPQSIFPYLRTGAALFWGHSIIAHQIETRFNTRLPSILVPVNGLLDNRNKTMVANLVRNLNEFPEVKNILAVVGQKHVDGMVSSLVLDHDFEVLSLDGEI